MVNRSIVSIIKFNGYFVQSNRSLCHDVVIHKVNECIKGSFTTIQMTSIFSSLNLLSKHKLIDIKHY